jgi:hypothetical protein
MGSLDEAFEGGIMLAQTDDSGMIFFYLLHAVLESGLTSVPSLPAIFPRRSFGQNARDTWSVNAPK